MGEGGRDKHRIDSKQANFKQSEIKIIGMAQMTKVELSKIQTLVRGMDCGDMSQTVALCLRNKCLEITDVSSWMSKPVLVPRLTFPQRQRPKAVVPSLPPNKAPEAPKQGSDHKDPMMMAKDDRNINPAAAEDNK
jgi:hypothetical protein